MFLKNIGLILLVLIIIVIVGNIWFNIVESVINKIKGLFNLNKGSKKWYPLPEENKEKKDTDKTI